MDCCPMKGACKLFPLFSLRASLKTWQIRYCESSGHAECERYKRLRTGRDVAPELLPNGKHLPAVKRKDQSE